MSLKTKGGNKSVRIEGKKYTTKFANTLYFIFILFSIFYYLTRQINKKKRVHHHQTMMGEKKDKQATQILVCKQCFIMNTTQTTGLTK